MRTDSPPPLPHGAGCQVPAHIARPAISCVNRKRTWLGTSRSFAQHSACSCSLTVALCCAPIDHTDKLARRRGCAGEKASPVALIFCVVSSVLLSVSEARLSKRNRPCSGWLGKRVDNRQFSDALCDGGGSSNGRRGRPQRRPVPTSFRAASTGTPRASAGTGAPKVEIPFHSKLPIAVGVSSMETVQAPTAIRHSD